MQALDIGEEVIIPLARAADLERVGPIAASFATLFGTGIHVLVVIDPDDDLLVEFARFGAAVDEFCRLSGRPVELHIIVSDTPLQAVLDACRGRVACMATAASPFQADHYVGSFAAALLAETTAPVVLVGPSVKGTPDPIARVVVAVSAEVDGHAAMVTGAHLARVADIPLSKIVVDPKGVIYETNFLDTDDALPDEVHASMVDGPLDASAVSDTLVERSVDGVLVLSTRAQRGLSWICEGSIAFEAIAHTSRPVVAVGPRALEDDPAQRPEPPVREVSLASPRIGGAVAELEERLRFLRKASSVTYTARPI